MIKRTVKKGVRTTVVFGMSALMAASPVLSALPVYAAETGSSSTENAKGTNTAEDDKSTITDDTKSETTDVSKEETAYVKADPSGKTEKITVSSRLKNAGLYSSVKDRSILKNIKNVKGDEEFSAKGGELTWETDGADIYYQGTTDKELPVGVDLTYYLDGKEISPDDLPGKSGKLKIKIKYSNYSRQTIDLGGKKVEINTPFIMLTGMILSPL